jgi:chemotaxis protein MotB
MAPSPPRADSSLSRLHQLEQHSEALSPNATNRWLLPYADMMTVLFGMLLVLGMGWATHQQQQVAQREAQLTQQLNQAHNHLVSTQHERDTLQQRLEAWQRQQQGLTLERTATGLTLSLDERLLFAPGEAQLPPHAQPVLKALAQQLANTTGTISIEGHTDATPIATARYPSNWELSADRAVTLVRWLIEHGGLAPERLRAVACAHVSPIASNSTIEGKQRNRRVAMLIADTLPSSRPVTQPVKSPPHEPARQTQSP